MYRFPKVSDTTKTVGWKCLWLSDAPGARRIGWILKLPWDIRKQGSQYAVVKSSDGRVVGTHPTKGRALAQLRALYASESRDSGKQ